MLGRREAFDGTCLPSSGPAGRWNESFVVVGMFSVCLAATMVAMPPVPLPHCPR